MEQSHRIFLGANRHRHERETNWHTNLYSPTVQYKKSTGFSDKNSDETFFCKLWNQRIDIIEKGIQVFNLAYFWLTLLMFCIAHVQNSVRRINTFHPKKRLGSSKCSARAQRCFFESRLLAWNYAVLLFWKYRIRLALQMLNSHHSYCSISLSRLLD